METEPGNRAERWWSDLGLAGTSRHEARSRVPTLDTLRGISITMVLYIHLAGAWRAPDWSTFLRVQWYATEFFGPAMFIAISIVGSMVSYFAQNAVENVDRPAANQKRSHPVSRKMLLRVSFLFIVGEYSNVFITGRLGLLHVTNWNIITAIALFSLLVPFLLRIPKMARLTVAIFILLAYYPIMNWSIATLTPSDINLGTISPEELDNPQALVYWLLFFHDQMAPVFSWLVVPLLVSIIFERFARQAFSGNKESLAREARRIAIAGIVLLVIGIVTGFQIAPDYVGHFNIEMATPDAYITWPWNGVFTFWIQSTPQYVLYNLGIICVAFGVLSYVQVVKGKRLPGERWINNFGRFSLTVFIISYSISQIPLDLPLPWFYLVVVPLIIVCIWLFKAWSKYARGTGSIEWLMDVYVFFIGHLIDKHRREKNKCGS